MVITANIFTYKCQNKLVAVEIQAAVVEAEAEAVDVVVDVAVVDVDVADVENHIPSTNPALIGGIPAVANTATNAYISTPKQM